MKKPFLIIIVALLVSLFLFSSASAMLFRWVKLGKYWVRVTDNGTTAETTSMVNNQYYTKNEHVQNFTTPIRCFGKRFGVVDFTDENGTYYPVRIGGAPYGSADNYNIQFELPYPGGEDEDQTLARYYRNPLPTITVEGFTYQERWLDYDEVNRNKIEGTADVMVESYFRTWLGLDIHQKVLGWTQKHHDDYVIYDYTITNTGNVDPDDDIELDATLDSLYILSQYEFMPNFGNTWSSYYGEHESDTLRFMYSYPGRSKNDTEDRFGVAMQGWGPSATMVPGSNYLGEAILHVSKSYMEPDVDDPAQPRMHAIAGPDDRAFKHNSSMTSPEDWLLVYKVMKNGYREAGQNVQYMHEQFPGTDVYPNTAHDVRLDERGPVYYNDFDFYSFWSYVDMNGIGPYQLPIGESIRFVFAQVAGTTEPEIIGPIIMIDWKEDKDASWDGPGNIDGDPTDLADYYPAYARDPSVAPEKNDRAKDRWVAASKDSVFDNVAAAQFCYDNNYNIPVPPPAPSIEVTGMADYILIEWGSESEAASDFDGYRVYRALGNPYWKLESGVELGVWEQIYEVTGTGTHSYQDTEAVRGNAYYYYVTAFDDGSDVTPDAKRPAGGEVLESGRYQNMTPAAAPASLKRQAGDKLADIRIVPNPYNYNTVSLNFPGERDKIMFYDLPLECTIRIYTESLDLVTTIEHYGSGDDTWGISGLPDTYMTSETGQRVVSGLYLAHFETPDGNSIIKKFVIVR